MSPLKRTGADGMSEQEADDLAEKIGRHVRFKVAGRRAVAGKGIHLQVTDQQTGFKHTIYSADHWRQVFNEMVLLVEGAWEDVTLAAIQQLAEEIAACGRRDRGAVQRARLLGAQQQVLLKSLEWVQRQTERIATATALELTNRARSWGTVGQETPRPRRRVLMWEGSFGLHGKKWRVRATSHEECWEKLAALRARVLSGDTTPQPRAVPKRDWRARLMAWASEQRGAFRVVDAARALKTSQAVLSVYVRYLLDEGVLERSSRGVYRMSRAHAAAETA